MESKACLERVLWHRCLTQEDPAGVAPSRYVAGETVQCFLVSGEAVQCAGLVATFSSSGIGNTV